MAPHPASGTMIGKYRVLSLLGRGGMGEVYAAEDTKLGRKVAIKVLPASLGTDSERLRRFTQEAKAASALNHPSILTIHDIDEIDGTVILVAEYIEGQTLRGRLRAGGLSLRESLDIVGHIANALAAAHAAGIVHRDVKPENIMLREDGLAKLVDFGLAKVEQDAPSSADETMVAAPDTTPGQLLGTTQYMSPEQARGLTVDARSDIFSLGVVLYEMVASHPPFQGATVSDLIVAILQKEPPPIEGLPAELEHILRKALEKDRDDRHQTAKDLAVDLRRFRKQMDGPGESLPRSDGGPGPSSQAWRSTPHAGSGQAPVLPRPSKRPWLVFVAVAAVVAIGGGFWWLRSVRPESPPAAMSFDDLAIEQLSGLGNVGSPAISSDGKYLAYVTAEAGQNSISLRQMATGSAVRIAGPTPNGLQSLTLTPDGNFLYYTERTASAPIRYSIMSIPALGGTATRVLEGRFDRVSFSPDGKQFVVAERTGKDSRLQVYAADGGGARTIGTRAVLDPYQAPSWSPSGAQIAVLTIDHATGDAHTQIQIFPTAGGPPRTITPIGAAATGIADLTWSVDDSALIIAAPVVTLNSPLQLLWVDAATGQTHAITNDLSDYHEMAFSRATHTIAAIKGASLGSIWVGSLDRLEEATEMPSRVGDNDGASGLAWVSNDRIAFGRVGSMPSVWVANIDGTSPRRLTEGAVSGQPVPMPDGRSVLFETDRLVAGIPEIFSVSIDGGVAQAVTRGSGAFGASVSPDGRTLFYRTPERQPAVLMRRPIAGGTAEKVFAAYSMGSAKLSPDGRWIAVLTTADASALPALVVVPAEGGPARTITEGTPGMRGIAWTPDSKSIFYSRVDERLASNLWRVDLAGGAARQVTHFTRQIISAISISPDGKRVAFNRGFGQTDIVLLRPKAGR